MLYQLGDDEGKYKPEFLPDVFIWFIKNVPGFLIGAVKKMKMLFGIMLSVDTGFEIGINTPNLCTNA